MHCGECYQGYAHVQLTYQSASESDLQQSEYLIPCSREVFVVYFLIAVICHFVCYFILGNLVCFLFVEGPRLGCGVREYGCHPFSVFGMLAKKSKDEQNCRY